MTHEQIEQHRKRFEEIIKSLRVVKYSLDRNEHDEYRQAAVFHMWSGYTLSAENQIDAIEKAHMAGQADAGVDPSYSNAKAYAIESQGIKVKP